jgi:hypothetical protein
MFPWYVMIHPLFSTCWCCCIWNELLIGCCSSFFFLSWEKQLKGGVIHFGSQFQRFRSMVGWLHYFGPEVRQSIMVDRAWLCRASHLRAARKQGARGRSRDKMYPSKAWFQWPPSSVKPHFLVSTTSQ